MLENNVQKSLNKQLNAEFFSSYKYLAMSAYFESVNLGGFAFWMKIQAQEEYSHAMKIYDYILQANGSVELTNIVAPEAKWKSALEVFEDTYKHEQGVTSSIYDLVELTLAEKDHATNIFLHWFVTEQVEEEATALKILERIKMVSDVKSGIFLLDREMGQRAAAKK